MRLLSELELYDLVVIDFSIISYLQYTVALDVLLLTMWVFVVCTVDMRKTFKLL